MHLLSLPALLGLLYGLSEAGIGYLKRSRDDSVDADRNSLWFIWLVIAISVGAGVVAAYRLTWASLGGGLPLQCVGAALFVAGIALRWYSIHYLGRFFTVNVAIHSGHEIIDTGPYSRIRHPSYAGALLAFFGLALSFDNGMTLALIMLPVAMAFRRRIRIEERALAHALGRPYTDYMQRTRRLVPHLY